MAFGSPRAERRAVGAEGTVRHYRGDSRLWDVVSGTFFDCRLTPFGARRIRIFGPRAMPVSFFITTARIGHASPSPVWQRRPDSTTVWAPSPGHAWIGGQGVPSRSEAIHEAHVPSSLGAHACGRGRGTHVRPRTKPRRLLPKLPDGEVVHDAEAPVDASTTDADAGVDGGESPCSTAGWCTTRCRT